MTLSLEQLEGASRRADPLADAAIEALGSSLEPGVDPLVVVEARRDLPAVARLLRDTRLPPEDPAVVARACRWALRYAPFIGLILATRSLPMLYAMPEIAAALTRTGALVSQAERRTLETARFLRVLAEPESFLPGGPAADAILRVRLLHAVVRARLRPTWRLPGPPIDQRSLLFTHLVFSAGLRQGMGTLGLHVPPDEAQDRVEMWRHIGARLGVEPGLIPRTPAEELATLRLLLEHACRPTAEGRALSRALIAGISWVPPYNLPEGALLALTRMMLGEPVSTLLDLPKPPFWARLPPPNLGPLRTLDQAARTAPPLRWLAESMGRAFSSAVLRSRLRGASRYEALPPERR